MEKYACGLLKCSFRDTQVSQVDLMAFARSLPRLDLCERRVLSWISLFMLVEDRRDVPYILWSSSSFWTNRPSQNTS